MAPRKSPKSKLSPDASLILVGNMKGCLSSIAAYHAELTPGQLLRLEVTYRQLQAIQEEVTGFDREPV
jgi:hypothetical protein